MSQSIVDALRAKAAQMRQDLADAKAAADARRDAVPVHRRQRILLFLATTVCGVGGLLAVLLGASPLALIPSAATGTAYAVLRLRN
jgi:hypothetical protein